MITTKKQRMTTCGVCKCEIPVVETYKSKPTGNRYCIDFKACAERRFSGHAVYEQGKKYMRPKA